MSRCIEGCRCPAHVYNDDFGLYDHGTIVEEDGRYFKFLHFEEARDKILDRLNKSGFDKARHRSRYYYKEGDKWYGQVKLPMCKPEPFQDLCIIPENFISVARDEFYEPVEIVSFKKDSK
jgi:hypothetical protein